MINVKKTFTTKHIIASFLIGALLMSSFPVLADNLSQIGKKVDSQAAVYINGDRVSDAIIIQKKAYVPARDVAETLGAKVEWKGSEGIVITSNFTTNEEVEEYNNNLIEYLDKKAQLEANIKTAKVNIEQLQSFVEKYNEDYLSQFDEQTRKIFLQEVEKSKIQIEEEKSKLVQYEKELAELEASKQESAK